MAVNWKDMFGVFLLASGVLLTLANNKTIGGMLVLIGIGFVGWRITDFLKPSDTQFPAENEEPSIEIEASKNPNRNGNGKHPS